MRAARRRRTCPPGYRVTGRWVFASGVRHAEWVGGSTLVSGTRTRLKVVMPAAAVQIHDNWRRGRPAAQAELRAVATLATEVAVDVATRAFRAAGGEALYQSSVLQRCWRDLNAAAQHFMVSDSAYENLGQFRLGLPDAHPMG